MIVNIEDIQRINTVPFDEIEWQYQGKPVTITPAEREAWKFTGLSNVTFIEFGEWNE